MTFAELRARLEGAKHDLGHWAKLYVEDVNTLLALLAHQEAPGEDGRWARPTKEGWAWIDLYLAAKARYPDADVWAPAVGVVPAVGDFLISLVDHLYRKSGSDGVILFVSIGKRRFELHLTEYGPDA